MALPRNLQAAPVVGHAVVGAICHQLLDFGLLKGAERLGPPLALPGIAGGGGPDSVTTDDFEALAEAHTVKDDTSPALS